MLERWVYEQSDVGRMACWNRGESD